MEFSQFFKGAKTETEGGEAAVQRKPLSPVEAKLQALHARLAQLQEGEGVEAFFKPKYTGSEENNKQQETIGDDAAFTEAQQAQLQNDEALVRAVLGLFEVDYDALIRLGEAEGEIPSPYARAVRANPAVMEAVATSERPVLTALQVALGFQPYAEFMDKYGDEPANIRDAIRKEMEAEMAKAQESEQPAETTLPVNPFSTSARRGSQQQGAYKRPALADIFKK